MRQLKIAVILFVAVVLQSSLRTIWNPLVYLDLPLVVVVYFALQRDPVQAVVIGTLAGLATDVFSGAVLGTGGFSKTLTAYMIATLATRIMIDNPLARIPVLAGAVLIDASVFFFLNRVFGQATRGPFVEILSYSLIATTIAGTLILYLLDMLFSERARQRRQLAVRRRGARRNPMRLGKRR